MKNLFKVLILILAVGTTASCGSTKKATASNKSTNPYGEAFYEMPCAMYDDDEYFAATGSAEGPRARLDVLQLAALGNAQQLCRRKVQHAYQGMVSDYSSYMGIDNKSSAALKLEGAGDQIIDAMINDTQAKCIKTSGVDEKGNVTMFVGIKISKKEIVDKMAKAISEDEELALRFKENQYREFMDQKMKEYKESKGGR